VADRKHIMKTGSQAGKGCVDLFVTTDLRTMTAVLMGVIPAQRAVTDGRIELIGPASLRRRFPSWLGLSPFAINEAGAFQRRQEASSSA
jgi:hypothetical protein